MSFLTAIEVKLEELKKHCASKYPLPKLRIGDKTAALSIVQGGMGVGISLSNLASPVVREGGIGVIAANAHLIEAIVPVKQLIEGLKQGYARAAFVNTLKTEVAKRAEMLKVLKGEYSATLAGLRGKVEANMRRLAGENEAKYRQEKARMHERLIQIKIEISQAKIRIRGLRSDLGILLNLMPSLKAI